MPTPTLFDKAPSLSEADRSLAAMFDGPLESETEYANRRADENASHALQMQCDAQVRSEWRAGS